MTLIKIAKSHCFEGQGEGLGKDASGIPYSFWKSTSEMDVPLEVALRLEVEVPQRYVMVDRKLADYLLNIIASTPVVSVPTEIMLPTDDITLVELHEMSKDEINDWGAKRDYDVNPGRMNKDPMIADLVSQIEARTGKKIQ